MSEVTPPIGDNDLHAYVDGQLETGRRSQVERHLLDNPADARLVAEYQAQRETIRSAFAAEAVHTELSLAGIIARHGRRPWMQWQVAACIIAALGVGTAAGWFLRGAEQAEPNQQAITVLAQEALTSHLVYAVDVSGSEAPHLQQWLSNRLQRMVVAPDLSALGYHLVGGRLLATENGGAAALLMYDDTLHHRVSVLLRPMTPALAVTGGAIQKDNLNGRAWIDGGLGIAVVAAMPETDLAPVAARIVSDLRPSR